MSLTEKAKIYYHVWHCAYRRRYNAKVAGNVELYRREHSTILMCLRMNDAQWVTFDSHKKRNLT